MRQLGLQVHGIGLIAVALLFMMLPLAAADKVETHGVSFNLPPGWHGIEKPKFAYAAATHGDAMMGLMIEKKAASPVPREIDEESSFETGFWGKFENNLEKWGKLDFVGHDFLMINGVPFREMIFKRDHPSDASMNIYSALLVTPDDGNLYEFMFVKKGAAPLEDGEIVTMMQSIAFDQPPRLAWYQPWLHETSNIIGMPLLLVAVGLGLYFWSIRGRPEVSIKKKQGICTWALVSAMVNSFWIAGMNNVIGITSMLFMAFMILALQKVNKEREVLVTQGSLPPPNRKLLKRNFVIMAVAGMFGLAMASAQMVWAGLSVATILGANIFTVAMFGLIFWSMRKKFFPPSTPPPPI